MTIILGLDPGTATTGYGVISEKRGKISLIDYGCIKTSSRATSPKRLFQIFEKVSEIIKKYKPDEIAIEELFFAANTKTAVAVGHARGVLVLACERLKKPVFEYTPLQVKQALVGYGRADKRQVQIMTKMLLELEEIPKPDDAADALAIAICHAHSRNISRLKRGS